MIKKLIALILCTAMLLSATGIFAAVTGTIDTGMVVYTDDFEHLEITENVTFARGETYASHATSDVFAGIIHNGNMSQLVYNEGKNGSKAFKLTAGNTNHNTIYTITPTKASQYYDNLVLTCDVKISYHTSTATDAVMLAGSNAYCNYPLFYVRYDATTGTNYITNEAGTIRADYDENKWYKLVVRKRVRDSSTAAHLADEDGNLIAEASRTQTWGAIVPIANKAAANSGAELIIDNVELKHYISTQIVPTIVSDPQIAGQTEVPTNTNSTSFSVDELLWPDATTATLTADGDTKTCTVTRDTSKLYTYTISWDGSLLEETDYTLNINGMKYDLYGNVATASYTFKTAESPEPDVASSTPVSGTENVSSELKQMTVTFNKEITEFPQTISLTSANDTVTANVSTSDNHVFTFAWNDELDGMATYTVNLAEFKNADGLSSKTKTVSFTTGNADMRMLADSFEDSAKLESQASYVSSLLTVDKNVAPPKLAMVDGYTTGTQALQATANGNVGLMRTTEKYKLIEGEKLIATWRFRIDNKAFSDGAADNVKNSTMMWIAGVQSGDYAATYNNASTAIRTKADGTLYINNPYEAAANNATLYEDKWYNITLAMDASEWTFYFVDDETDEVIYTRKTTNANLASEAYIKPFAAGKSSSTDSNTGVTTKTNDGLVVTIDDFTLWEIKPGRSTHKLASSGSITEDDGTVTINFNQPVLPDAAMFSLYYGDGELAYKRPEIRQPDFCKVEIDYTGLDKLTDYTLDYSGAKAISGAEIGDKETAVYNFKSAPADSDVSVVGDVYCTGLTNGSKISTNVYSKATRTVDIVAAFYEKTYPAKLTSVVVEHDVYLRAGENSVDIQLDKDIDAEIVKLFILDDMGTLVPLMEKYKTLTPLETLDILLIGSSLSEDSGRLFDQILAAAGHNTTDNRDINVTVKFVGGGSFVYHYNNLKREIDSNLDEAILNGDTDTLQDYVDTQNGIMAGTIASSDADTSRRLYTTFENGVTQTDGPEDRIMLSALMEKQYDFISIQPSAHAYDYNSMMNGTEEEDFIDYATELNYLTSTIREYQPNAEIVLFQTWTHYYGSAPYGDKTRRHKYFTNLIKPYVDKWAAATGENVENITDGGEALVISPVGYAFYLADEFLPWAGSMYNLDSGNNTADAKAEEELRNKFNTSQGLLRDADHASYYGTFLADAVWYELFTGNRASAGTVADPAITRPTGVGPLLQNGVAVDGQTKTYFTITPEEHHARLEALADIAHQAVKEYDNLKRIVK